MKEPVKRTQESAWRGSHWISLGQFYYQNDDSDELCPLNKITTHESTLIMNGWMHELSERRVLIAGCHC